MSGNQKYRKFGFREFIEPADQQRRILDLLGAERDAAWAEAERLKAALGVESEACG